MQTKPLVGLNADFRTATKDAPAFSYIQSGYYDAIHKAGALPLIVPPLLDEKDVDQLLDRLDGFVMIGGADLDPRRDGYMLHPSVRLLGERREKFDRMLIDRIASRRIPVFAIGTGMQLLNVSQGGDLFLHIPEDVPTALPHTDSLDPAHRHALDVVPGTLVERVYGDGEVRVNSFHHMAVDKVAPDFIVSARCPDGIVEAIESKRDDWFVLGTQFHPEADSASALDLRLFEEFVLGLGMGVSEVRLVA